MTISPRDRDIGVIDWTGVTAMEESQRQFRRTEIPSRPDGSAESQVLSSKSHFGASVSPQPSEKPLILDSRTSVLDVAANAEYLGKPDLPRRVAIKLDIWTKDEQKIWFT